MILILTLPNNTNMKTTLIIKITKQLLIIKMTLILTLTNDTKIKTTLILKMTK